jgi:hypothetical protein
MLQAMELDSQLSSSATRRRPPRDPWSGSHQGSLRIRRWPTGTPETSRPTSPWTLTSPATSGRDSRTPWAQPVRQADKAPLILLSRVRRRCSRGAGATGSRPMPRLSLASRSAQGLSQPSDRRCSRISRGPGALWGREVEEG